MNIQKIIEIMKYDEYDWDDSEGRLFPNGTWLAVVALFPVVACLLIALFVYLGAM